MTRDNRRICVAGAGAIGGYLAARLAGIGAEVSVVVRGRNLEAIRRDGLTLINEDGSEQHGESYFSQWQVRIRAAEEWNVAAGRDVLKG